VVVYLWKSTIVIVNILFILKFFGFMGNNGVWKQ